jgi:NAD(P)-dependent dehydrogenase (short-subunit alcohol dehydrogenase family)
MAEGLLAGKTALITGGAQGLGRAILDGFACAGARGSPRSRRRLPIRCPTGWVFEAGDVAQEAKSRTPAGRPRRASAAD